jgi:hypothetical protein
VKPILLTGQLVCFIAGFFYSVKKKMDGLKWRPTGKKFLTLLLAHFSECTIHQVVIHSIDTGYDDLSKLETPLICDIPLTMWIGRR